MRAGVGDVLGAPVVRADSQAGGFSPGSADRVVTATGRRAFVKAVGPEPNAHSPQLHRREGRISAALPPSLPVPRLLGTVDDGGWVALVLEEVDGHQPALPWRPADVAAVLDALAALAAGATPCPVPDLPAAADALREDFAGFERLAADGVRLAGLDELRDLAHDPRRRPRRADRGPGRVRRPLPGRRPPAGAAGPADAAGVPARAGGGAAGVGAPAGRPASGLTRPSAARGRRHSGPRPGGRCSRPGPCPGWRPAPPSARGDHHVRGRR